MKKFLTSCFISFFIAISFSLCLARENLQGKVISVSDGDTVTILGQSNVQTKIRFYGIDCPEKSQPFGDKATSLTSKLVRNQDVEVTAYDIDKYGRTVGVVMINGNNVNEQLIKAGLAWQYQKYCKESFCDKWIQLEVEARKSNLGLWTENSPTPPWDWRRGNNGQPVVSVGGSYHGNRNSHVFHQSSCRVFNCKNCTVVFETREQAIKNGFRPCGICKP